MSRRVEGWREGLVIDSPAHSHWLNILHPQMVINSPVDPHYPAS